MEKEKAWTFALNMIKVDDLKPSKEFLNLIEKEKRGEISTIDIYEQLKKKYCSKGNQ